MKTSGNKRYTIKYLKHVLKRNLPSLPEDIKLSIKDAIKEYLETDPIGNGVLLRNRLKGHRRVKVADDYRIVYRINIAKRIVTIVSIGHRDIIYNQAILDLLKH
ncbi:type II toxin-antitoxin system RelE family toxin [Candidatus Wolbachia massiliensis]|uniref:Type II toxin-antitoxin system RelE/ParE family toxin n=1 Tax=Candidatus Wolbachia massiliensis TaxID=1845000 RepID=A0A7L7YLS8_9RICK|nr:type II toxin-antitoxin system RelE/ParE family toxin [Candidatus Wolbachia massiliensis]QOD38174.1 type II toxin-antitoxin system RelE/ParE family toxin [Candidatus Wolbachia massiliensis]